jgi:hypothetical protein
MLNEITETSQEVPSIKEKTNNAFNECFKPAAKRALAGSAANSSEKFLTAEYVLLFA